LQPAGTHHPTTVVVPPCASTPTPEQMSKLREDIELVQGNIGTKIVIGEKVMIYEAGETTVKAIRRS